MERESEGIVPKEVGKVWWLKGLGVFGVPGWRKE